MEDNKFQRAYNLKLISDEFNNLSDYENSTGIFTTFRYNDPNKEHLIKYFKDLYYKVELFEPGLIKGEKKEPTEEELKNAPYRQYLLMLNWEE